MAPIENGGERQPLKSPLTFSVGVVGHRPGRLKFADLAVLSSRFHQLLATVRATVESVTRTPALVSARPNLRAVSPLAEGTDRIFAAAALDESFDLFCPMPFPQSEFEKDFRSPRSDHDSVKEFRELLARAAQRGRLTRLEMNGDPDRRVQAYAACTEVVLHHSTLLFLVWDGEREGRSGGTESAFDEVCGGRIPTVWIDAVAPHEWQLLTSSSPARDVPGARMTPFGGMPSALNAMVRHIVERQ